jgi:hypothetical protein
MDALVTGKLLDTTVLIDLSRGNSTAAEYVDSERTAGALREHKQEYTALDLQKKLWNG